MNGLQLGLYHCGASTDFIFSGRLNRSTGWLLLVATFAGAAWLDPQAFDQTVALSALGNRPTFLRHGQIMITGLAFLQLVSARLLALPSSSRDARRTAPLLTALGTLVTVAGYVAAIQSVIGLALILAGSLINIVGLMALSGDRSVSRNHWELRGIFVILGCAMLLEAVAVLFELQPGFFLPAYLGPAAGLRMRLLRLARVAALVLPVLTLLHWELMRTYRLSRPICWGSLAMLCGALGMPTVLVAASFTYVELKVLLSIPAIAILAGALSGAGLARKQASPLERSGWLLISLSMAAGMVMGVYAFLSPPLSLNLLADYNDETRRLIRLAHGYAILLGVVNIFVARELEGTVTRVRARCVGIRLLFVAETVTIVVILLRAGIDLPPAVLGLGPGLVTIAIALCIGISATIAQPNTAFRQPRHVGGAS